MSEHISGEDNASNDAEAVKLCTCPRCRFFGVQPVDWQEASVRHWRIWLRCPNCELRLDREVADGVVDHYDLQLERLSAELAKTLHDITEENNDIEARKLREALDTGLILPEDF